MGIGVFKKSLQGLLVFWFLVAALVPLGIIVSFQQYTVRREMSAYGKSSMGALARTLATSVDWYLKDMLDLFEAMSRSPALGSGDRALALAELKRFRDSLPQEVELIFFATPDGKAINSEGKEVEMRDRAYFQEALQGKRAVSEVRVSATTGTKVISLAVPVVQAGRIIGVFGGNVGVGRFTSEVEATLFGKSGYAYMVDRRGVAISHPKPENILKLNITQSSSESLNRIGREIVKGGEGFGRYVWEGVDKFVFWAPVRCAGWAAVVTSPVGEFYGPADGVFKSALWGSILLLGFALFLAWFLARMIAKPVVRFASQAEALSTGDLRVEIDEGHTGELGILGRALKQMVANTRAVVSAVKEAAADLDRGIQEISRAAGDSAKAAVQVAEAIGQVSAGTQDMAGTVNTIMHASEEGMKRTRELEKRIEEIAARTEETALRTREGEKLMQELAAKIEETSTQTETLQEVMGLLEERARQISGIADVITRITDQINLLALNAAIEAARAGEYGRGFAVVAEEVRKLAEESRAQAGEVAALVSKIADDVGRAVRVTRESASRVAEQGVVGKNALEHFLAIAAGAEQIAGFLAEIDQEARMVREQSEQISREVSNIAALSQQNAASAEEIAASAEELSASAEGISSHTRVLTDLMEKLKEKSGHFLI